MSTSNVDNAATTTAIENPTKPSSDPTETPNTTVESSRPISTAVPAEQTAATMAAPATATAETPVVVSNEPSSAEAPPVSSPTSATKSEQAVRISLLLSTGNRHPFTINNKFLQRHNIQAAESDPWNIKVYEMKTLIWHEWLGEWETRPTSPALIRLIFLGGLLDDKAVLADCRLSKTEPNVVHMTVKPQDLLEDDEVKGKEQKAGSTRERRSGGCCVIL